MRVVAPFGEIVVGVAGTEGAAVFAVTDLAPLHALVPKRFDAFTNQLYVTPFAKAFGGVIEHVPPPEHPAEAASTTMLTATPDVFCTSR